MKRVVTWAFVCIISLPTISQAQIGDPDHDVIENPCPTNMISSFPQGDDQTICVWFVTDCTTGATGTMYGACSGEACGCMGTSCGCSGENFLEAAGTQTLENAPPSTGPGPGPGPGAALNSPDLPVTSLDGLSSSHILTSNSPIQAKGQKKCFCSNKVDLTRTTPAASKLVPATANSITTFGKGDYKTKYIKSLKLKVGSFYEFYALFKIFKDDSANPNGDQDLVTDHYVGVRMSEPSAEPAGGYEELDSSTANRVKKLARFGDPSSTTGHVREVVVQLPITRGANGTPLTWFHLFGTVM